MINPKYCNHWVSTEESCVNQIKEAIKFVTGEPYDKHVYCFTEAGSENNYILMIKANDLEWKTIRPIIESICEGRRMDIL